MCVLKSCRVILPFVVVPLITLLYCSVIALCFRVHVIQADAASKTSASASSSGNCVASALRHMSGVQAARQTRPALLAIGVPRPAEATPTTEPAAELSPSAVSQVENGHTPVGNAAASVVTSPRSPTHPNPTPTQTSPQSNQHPLSSPPNSAPLDEPHVDEETMDEDP
eukprot:scpid89614/ scgid4863/ 